MCRDLMSGKGETTAGLYNGQDDALAVCQQGGRLQPFLRRCKRLQTGVLPIRQDCKLDCGTDRGERVGGLSRCSV